ncbi:hypothetical protein [Qipengyuania sp. JC766]|uniref:hypothetical protein n=1 Tax=Qipengyuania sp. JC766 TaxID=3232139 RepID=UPI0034580799
MIELVEANWPYILIAVILGIAVAWFVLVANRRTKVVVERSDALDEGAQKTARNQALIDSPSAGETPRPPAGAFGLAGSGTAVAAAVEEQAVERVKAKDEAERADPPETEAQPEPQAGATAPQPQAAAAADDLTRIKGLGPKLQATLVELGVTRFDQIAAWDDAEIDRIDAQLGRFQGRIRRDDWVTQARLLAADDTAGYEAQFGKL